MITHTFEAITWQINDNPTIADDLLEANIIRRVSTSYPADEIGIFDTFGSAMAKTIGGENLPINVANIREQARDVNVLRQAYEQFIRLDRRVITEWLVALGKAEQVIDAAYGPTQPAEPNFRRAEMQEQLRAHWKAVANHNEIPDYMTDFGFYNDPQFVIETATQYLNHNILPKAGGWLDQDATWRKDFFVYSAGLARAHWEKAEADKRENGTS